MSIILLNQSFIEIEIEIEIVYFYSHHMKLTGLVIQSNLKVILSTEQETRKPYSVHTKA